MQSRLDYACLEDFSFSAQLNTETNGWRSVVAVSSHWRTKMHKIFVYGTLMRGEDNFHVMRNCEFLGEGKTPGSVFGYGFAPGAVSPQSEHHMPGSLIHGELFLVPQETKEILDEMEGVDMGNYTLTPVWIEMTSGVDEGATLKGEIYFHNHWRSYGKYHAGRWKTDNYQ